MFVFRTAPPTWTAQDSGGAPQGWVAYQVEITATFLQPQNLRDFPFDRQLVQMDLESRVHDTSAMRSCTRRPAGRLEVTECAPPVLVWGSWDELCHAHAACARGTHGGSPWLPTLSGRSRDSQ